MDWLYFIKNQIDREENKSSMYQMFLRVFKQDENKEFLVGEQIVIFDIFCLEKVMNSEFATPEIKQIYFEKLNDKNYHLENHEISENQKKLYCNYFVLYLKEESLTINEMKEWVKKIFLLHQLPSIDIFQESDFNNFADTNPIMQMFSLENVKKFEDKFGKEWWKKKDDKENDSKKDE